MYVCIYIYIYIYIYIRVLEGVRGQAAVAPVVVERLGAVAECLNR